MGLTEGERGAVMQSEVPRGGFYSLATSVRQALCQPTPATAIDGNKRAVARSLVDGGVR